MNEDDVETTAVSLRTVYDTFPGGGYDLTHIDRAVGNGAVFVLAPFLLAQCIHLWQSAFCGGGGNTAVYRTSVVSGEGLVRVPENELQSHLFGDSPFASTNVTGINALVYEGPEPETVEVDEDFNRSVMDLCRNPESLFVFARSIGSNPADLRSFEFSRMGLSRIVEMSERQVFSPPITIVLRTIRDVIESQGLRNPGFSIAVHTMFEGESGAVVSPHVHGTNIFSHMPVYSYTAGVGPGTGTGIINSGTPFLVQRPPSDISRSTVRIFPCPRDPFADSLPLDEDSFTRYPGEFVRVHGNVPHMGSIIPDGGTALRILVFDIPVPVPE